MIAINVFSFIIYGFDKFQAIVQKRRIPEKGLLILASIGGCFGAFLGMIIFHHKVRKRKFQILIPIMVMIWSTILIKKGGV